MKTLLMAAAVALSLSAHAEGGISAKALFYGTDGSVMSVATTPPAAAAVATASRPAPARATRTAARKPNVFGAGYFIRLKKDDGSTRDVLASRTFRSGERFQLGVKVNRPAYVYIYNKDAEGKVTRLYPQPGQSNFVDAMGVVFFPSQGNFQFDRVPGDEQLLVYLSPNEIRDVEGRFAQSQPDLMAEPVPVASRTGACQSVPEMPASVAPATPTAPSAIAVADSGSFTLASKGIEYAAQDSCAGAPGSPPRPSSSAKIPRRPPAGKWPRTSSSTRPGLPTACTCSSSCATNEPAATQEPPMSNSHLIVGLGGNGGKIIREVRKIHHAGRDEKPGLDVDFEYLYLDTSDDELSKKDEWKVLGTDSRWKARSTSPSRQTASSRCSRTPAPFPG